MTSGSQELPSETFFRIALGCRNTQALYVVAKLGVADLLIDGPMDGNHLAQKLGVNSGSLFRLMRALAAQGIFTQDSSDRFGLAAVSQLLRSDSPDSMRYVAISIGEEYYRSAGDLMHTVRTGETAFDHVFGKAHFDYLAEHEDASRTFNLFMAQSLHRYGDPLMEYDFGGRSLIVDVGGGSGTLVAQILRKNLRLRGILFDLPQGVAEAPELLRAEGVSDRCRIVTGSFFDSIPEGGDVYIMSRILHDWTNEKASRILSNCRKALGDTGTLLIQESVIPERDIPSLGKQTDLTMLFMTGGLERTEAEWNDLLEGSGLTLSRIVRTGLPQDLIEARPGPERV